METSFERAITELPLLTPTDIRVLRQLLEGDAAEFNEPITGDKADASSWEFDRTVSCEIVQWLCINCNDIGHNLSLGIRIRGAKIRGRLNLSNLKIPFQISLCGCILPEGLDIRGTSVAALDLSGTRISGIDGDRLDVSGDVLLNNGFISDKPVCLMGVSIKGDLRCSKGQFNCYQNLPDIIPPRGCEDCRSRTLHAYALVLERAKIYGSLYLCGDFSSTGGVHLLDAFIGVNVNCTEGIFNARNQLKAPVFEGKENGRRLACEGDDEHHHACAFNGDGMHVKGNLLMNGVKIYGEVRLTGAEIEGDIESIKGEFSHQDSNAISADRIRVRGNVFFCDKFTVKGKVRLPRAEIGSDLSLYCSNIIGPESSEFALYCEGMKVKGTVYMNRIETSGGVDLSNSDIGRNLYCTDGKLLNKGRIALKVDNARIEGSAYLNGENANEFRSEGCVSLTMARIGMNLVCNKGNFEHHSPCAIKANALSVGGEVEIEGSTAIGGLGLDDSVIGSYLSCSGSHIVSPTRGDGQKYETQAISAGKLQVGGSIYFNNKFRADGVVMLNDVSIGRNLNCHDGAINNPLGYSLQAERMKVAGSVNLTKNFESHGEINISDAVIGVDLDCSDGTFINISKLTEQLSIESKESGRNAIRADGVIIQGNAKFKDFRANGIVSLKSACIGRYLSWVDVKDSDKIELNLHSAKTHTFEDEPNSWPEKNPLHLNGFEYQFLDDHRHIPIKQRLKYWINLQEHFHPQPYEHLASVLKRCGHEDEARIVLIEKNRMRRKQKINWPKFINKLLQPWTARSQVEQKELQSFRIWLYQALLGVFVSYGYSPLKALCIGLGFVMLGAGLFNQGFQHGVMVKTEEKSCVIIPSEAHNPQCNGCEGPKIEDYVESLWTLDAVIYSLDVFLPVVDLNSGACWAPNKDSNHGKLGPFLYAYHSVHILMGWLISTLFLASLGGIMRR